MNYQFTKFGIAVFAVVLWVAAQSGSPDVKSTINKFLLVLFASMVLLNWSKISPLFLSEKATYVKPQKGKTNSSGQTQLS